MKNYEFVVILYGKGDTEGEAWTDAVDAFCTAPGEPSETTELEESDD